MSIITVPLTRPWHIKLPVLFRYLEQKYIDVFFKTGSLHLSTFTQFSKHKDEARCDPSEGWAAFEIKHEKSSLSGLGIFGRESYVLSTSIVEASALMEKFGYDGYFRIDDSVAFAAAVAMQLPGFFEGFQGSCIYTDKRALSYATDTPVLGEIPRTEKDAEEWEKRLEERMHRELKFDPHFLKSPKYSYQNEYRLLWCVSGRPQPYIDILCPEAIKHCTKIT